ncbi:MAG: hypothetical protein HWQ35_33775 [Nostoc sp. NMS1]|nr:MULTISPECIES: hypothetical protein [unclassified Nostoc]MBN3911326.1 hypothetical protein [Nostoc sp. NMS1]MBN3995070.1 hypothetical protein [Nostoc sp. NMS2]
MPDLFNKAVTSKKGWLLPPLAAGLAYYTVFSLAPLLDKKTTKGMVDIAL